MVDGFYALFYTGKASSGFAIVVLRSGIITGADAGGGLYDGEYTINTEKQLIEGTMTLTVPPGVALVTGASISEHPYTQQFPFSLPLEPNGQQVVRVETSTGPVNLRLKKIRDSPASPALMAGI